MSEPLIMFIIAVVLMFSAVAMSWHFDNKMRKELQKFTSSNQFSKSQIDALGTRVTGWEMSLKNSSDFLKASADRMEENQCRVEARQDDLIRRLQTEVDLLKQQVKSKKRGPVEIVVYDGGTPPPPKQVETKKVPPPPAMFEKVFGQMQELSK